MRPVRLGPAQRHPRRMPSDPLTADEVARLTDPLTDAEIQAAKHDVDVRAIMALPHHSVRATRLRRIFMALTTLGYSEEWLAGKLGTTPEAIYACRALRLTGDDAWLLLRMATLAVRIGCRRAAPSVTGETEEQIQARINEMRKMRKRRTPMSFLPDFSPVHGATNANPAGRSTAQVDEAIVRMLAHFCRHGGSLRDLSREFGISEKRVTEARRNSGLRLHFSGRPGEPSQLAPGQEALVKIILAADAALDVDAADPTGTRKAMEAECSALFAAQTEAEASATERTAA